MRRCASGVPPYGTAVDIAHCGAQTAEIRALAVRQTVRAPLPPVLMDKRQLTSPRSRLWAIIESVSPHDDVAYCGVDPDWPCTTWKRVVEYDGD